MKVMVFAMFIKIAGNFILWNLEEYLCWWRDLLINFILTEIRLPVSNI